MVPLPDRNRISQKHDPVGYFCSWQETWSAGAGVRLLRRCLKNVVRREMEYGSCVLWRRSRNDTQLSGRRVVLQRQAAELSASRASRRVKVCDWRMGEPGRVGVSRSKTLPHQKGAVLEAGGRRPRLQARRWSPGQSFHRAKGSGSLCKSTSIFLCKSFKVLRI